LQRDRRNRNRADDQQPGDPLAGRILGSSRRPRPSFLALDPTDTATLVGSSIAIGLSAAAGRHYQMRDRRGSQIRQAESTLPRLVPNRVRNHWQHCVGIRTHGTCHQVHFLRKAVMSMESQRPDTNARVVDAAEKLLLDNVTGLLNLHTAKNPYGFNLDEIAKVKAHRANMKIVSETLVHKIERDGPDIDTLKTLANVKNDLAEYNTAQLHIEQLLNMALDQHIMTQDVLRL
jgi:hypothetical protein